MQNTRFKLAEAKTIAHVARVFIDSCIQRLIAGTLDTVTAAMAKWWTTQMLRLHARLSDLPDVRRCTGPEDLRRRQ
jgi:alkylation response protein AidB-like acyl-CoA dehydrogenase